MLCGLPLLAAGCFGLFHPPLAGSSELMIWLTLNLVLGYLGLSLVSVNYLAWGATLTDDYALRTTVTATRAACGLAGVLAAALLPQWLSANTAQGLARVSEIFVVVLLVAAACTLRVRYAPLSATRSSISLRKLFLPYRDSRFRILMSVAVVSGLAGAIPATLILFFVQDVLRAEEYQGVFLALYFVGAACAMPMWVRVAARHGKRCAWISAMCVAIASFAWVLVMGESAIVPFALVSFASGAAYGAELAIPPPILADLVDAARTAENRSEGTYFGAWQMIEKLTFALAAGLALPLLQWGGYQPGQPQAGWSLLLILYALIPCVLKLVALVMLTLSKVDRIYSKGLAA